MSSADHLYRFIFEHANVRGEIVHLEDAYQEVLARAEYPRAVREMLGRAMGAAALLASTIKFRGALIMQVQAEGPLSLLVVQATSSGGLRGVARWDGDLPEHATLGELCPQGRLAITIVPEEGERYQGIVPLEGGSLAAALDHYFQNSEQLPTRVWLVADEQRVAGMLVQRLPGESGDSDAWNRAEQLANTITEPELLELSAPEIIHRLFHEEDIRLFDPIPFHFQCGCSREKVDGTLRSLGYDEMQEVLAEHGEVSVSCDFCNERYRYDQVDIEQLFAADPNTPSVSRTRH